MFLATLGYCFGRAGKRDAALDVVRILERRSAEQYVSPLDMCIANAGLDRHDAALAWLEKAVGQRVMRVTELGMPLFDDLRNESGFTEFPQAAELFRLIQIDKLSGTPFAAH
jgi:hypothetical protein